MTNKHGDWIWYELMTPDAEGAAAFYAAILPWTVGDQPEYREIETSAGHVGGMMTLTAEMQAGGATPGWVGYVKVENVDQTVTSVEHGGGRVLMPARDLPEAGRFAMVADPAGSRFYIMTPRPTAGNPDASSNAFAYDAPIAGHVAWNELWTADAEHALKFYTQRFGWVTEGEMDMGPAGKYHMIRHGSLIGGVAGVSPGQPAGWTFYFRVASIPAAVETVKQHGGTIVMGPHQIPGGDHIIIGADPQGAQFALVGGKE
ncbi:VOC domain-containing protein [Sphingomonas antarctica]|uniref:VOC family protein n=1 Tax=Sphingomonas antarctica TaxID=2040274 RepID=UPI0039EB873F